MCLICCLSPSASAFQASGSPVEGRGEAPCLVTVKLRGDGFSGSESHVNALGVGLQQWTESGISRVTLVPRLLVGDVTLMSAFYTPL